MNAWGSQRQPDVRKLFHTVLPFGCILAGPFPAEERHRETRSGARGEGGGEFKLTHYHPLTRLDRCSACRAAETGLNAQGICMVGSTEASEKKPRVSTRVCVCLSPSTGERLPLPTCFGVVGPTRASFLGDPTRGEVSSGTGRAPVSRARSVRAGTATRWPIRRGSALRGLSAST